MPEISSILDAPLDMVLHLVNALHLEDTLYPVTKLNDMDINALLTSKWLGFPLMILILLAVFQCTFTLGAYPQGWIESGVNALCNWLGGVLAPGWFSSMMVDGVLQVVGSGISALRIRFFPNHRALVMVLLYAIGILLSILFSFVMKHTRWFRMVDEDYVSVLPPFRMPTWRNTGLHIWGYCFKKCV